MEGILYPGLGSATGERPETLGIPARERGFAALHYILPSLLRLKVCYATPPQRIDITIEMH
jgi:hypothetical protein